MVSVVDSSTSKYRKRRYACFFSSALQNRCFCNIIMMKMERCTFIFLLWVDFKTAEPVVGQETTELPDGYSFPGQIHRLRALLKNSEGQRLCEWNWKKIEYFKKEWTEQGTFTFLSLCVLWWTVYVSLYLLLIFVIVLFQNSNPYLHQVMSKSWSEDTYLPLCGKKHTFYLSEVSY